MSVCNATQSIRISLRVLLFFVDCVCVYFFATFLVDFFVAFFATGAGSTPFFFPRHLISARACPGDSFFGAISYKSITIRMTENNKRNDQRKVSKIDIFLLYRESSNDDHTSFSIVFFSSSFIIPLKLNYNNSTLFTLLIFL